MSVREVDKKKSKSSGSGWGLAAAAVGIGIGAGLYYLLGKTDNANQHHQESSQEALDLSDSDECSIDNEEESDDNACEGDYSDYECGSGFGIRFIRYFNNSPSTYASTSTSSSSSSTTSSPPSTPPVESSPLNNTSWSPLSDQIEELHSSFDEVVNFDAPRQTSAAEERNNAYKVEAFRKRAWTLEECSICIEVMLLDTVTLPCGHKFHNNCVNSWLEENKTCPTCRKEV